MKKIIIMLMLLYLSIHSVFAYTNSSQSDTRLMSLIVRGATISPQFVSSKTSYSAKTANSSISISAMAASSQATVSGTGSFDLNNGANQFNVVVKAGNGATQTYSISVTRTSKETTSQQTKTTNTVTTTYKGKKYTVADNLSKVPFPENFGISSTVLGSRTVVAIKHQKASLYAVYLRDSSNKGAFYIVKNKKVSGLLNIISIDDHEYISLSHDAPSDNMEKVMLKLGSKSVTGYKYKDDAYKNYTLIYLLGNHKKPYFYAYEESEGTLQKAVTSVSQNNGLNTVLLLIAFFFGIAFLIAVFKYRSFKKMSAKRFKYYAQKIRKLESEKNRLG